MVLIRQLLLAIALALVAVPLARGRTVPVEVTPVHASHGMVVAGHPAAAAIGVEVLKGGGNAIDAAVAVSLALGVAEPYASGLGGKLMLLHFDRRTGRTHAVDGMDQAGWSLDVADIVGLQPDERRYGWKSVCVPGLPAALELAHRRWGTRPWAELVAPAAALARRGFEVLPRTADLFAERAERLRGDAELARLYLPGGTLPAPGSLLANPDLARSLDLIAVGGAAAFYRGPIAEAVIAAQQGRGYLTRDDFARYEARVVEPLGVDWRGLQLAGGPPPTTGTALVLPVLRALERETWTGEFRSAESLGQFGRVWRLALPHVQSAAADVPDAREQVESLLEESFIERLRAEAGLVVTPEVEEPARAAATSGESAVEAEPESVHASTTHFVVVDAQGNVVSATQSLSLHFGAGLVAPGTGIILNDTLSNFAFSTPGSVNFVAPGKRPRSTITPMIVLREGRPVLALGVPGAQRIPSAVAQVLIDHFVFGRALAEAIGDTRIHLVSPLARDDPDNVFEVEESLPAELEIALVAAGWQVRRIEAAGRGRHFGGVNSVELHADGTKTGYADPRRTNAAAGH